MTKEELKQKAKVYREEHTYHNSILNATFVNTNIEESYITGATDVTKELQEEIEELKEQIEKMTKEEIKKEAIQYAIEYPTSYGKGYKHKDLRIAYLAGAEPREKHIEELEKENAELKAYNEKLLDGDIEKHNKIVELQNRNGELAGQVASLNRWLSEAKELIRNLLRVTYGEGWNYSLDWKVKAEQFLKE